VSQQTIFDQPYFNHDIEAVPNIMADECTAVMQAFFKRRRAEKKALKALKQGS
jgi:tRNA(adenine34) deaminase